MIQFDHVTFQYEKALTPALSEIDLEIRAGEFVAIVGHNGSGKSTLAKHVNGLLLPTEGTVTVCGMETSNEDDLLSIRQKVGMAFQNPDNQLVTTIVEEDVAFGPENLGIDPKEIRSRVDEALASVGMSDYAAHAVHHLSGGQKQRIAIARVFLKNPPILVLDEATSALDSVTEAAIQHSLEELSSGRTVIVVAHRLSTIRGADHIAVIENERVAEYGTHEELLAKGGIYAGLWNTQKLM